MAILACCMTVTVQAANLSSPASFWSLLRGDSLAQTAHLAVPEPKTLAELKSLLQKNGKLTLVVFGAAWCGPSRFAYAYFDQKVTAAGVPGIWVDIDKNEQAANAYEFHATPTFKVLDKTGAEKWSMTQGALPAIDKGIEFIKK